MTGTNCRLKFWAHIFILRVWINFGVIYQTADLHVPDAHLRAMQDVQSELLTQNKAPKIGISINRII